MQLLNVKHDEAKWTEWWDSTALITAEVGHLILKPSAHTCHTTSISHLANGGWITASIHSINDYSRNIMGQDYDCEWLMW